MSHDTPAAVEVQSTEPPPDLPPLKISHLMLWTAVTAVLTAISRQWLEERESVLLAAASLLWVVTAAADFGVVLLGCLWRRRGLPFFTQPGHTLAVLSVFGVLTSMLQLIASSLYSLLAEHAPQLLGDQILTGVIYAPNCLVVLVSLIVACRAWRSTARGTGWRWVMLLMLIGSLISLTLYVSLVVHFAMDAWWLMGWYVIFYHATGLNNLFTGVVVAVVCVNEYARRGVPRHWTHWVPAVSCAWGGFASALWHYFWWWDIG